MPPPPHSPTKAKTIPSRRPVRLWGPGLSLGLASAFACVGACATALLCSVAVAERVTDGVELSAAHAAAGGSFQAEVSVHGAHAAGSGHHASGGASPPAKVTHIYIRKLVRSQVAGLTHKARIKRKPEATAETEEEIEERLRGAEEQAVKDGDAHGTLREFLSDPSTPWHGEERHEYRAEFEKFADEGGHTISERGFKAMVEQLGLPADQWELGDFRNHDGKLNFEDFVLCWDYFTEYMKGPNGKPFESAFNAIDTNRDGIIDVSEFRKTFLTGHEDDAAVLTFMDILGASDGKMDYDNFVKLMEKKQ